MVKKFSSVLQVIDHEQIPALRAEVGEPTEKISLASWSCESTLDVDRVHVDTAMLTPCDLAQAKKEADWKLSVVNCGNKAQYGIDHQRCSGLSAWSDQLRCSFSQLAGQPSRENKMQDVQRRR